MDNAVNETDSGFRKQMYLAAKQNLADAGLNRPYLESLIEEAVNEQLTNFVNSGQMALLVKTELIKLLSTRASLHDIQQSVAKELTNKIKLSIN